MKPLDIIALISAGIGVTILLVGFILAIVNRGYNSGSTYLLTICFFLISIGIYIYQIKDQGKK